MLCLIRGVNWTSVPNWIRLTLSREKIDFENIERSANQLLHHHCTLTTSLNPFGTMYLYQWQQFRCTINIDKFELVRLKQSFSFFEPYYEIVESLLVLFTISQLTTPAQPPLSLHFGQKNAANGEYAIIIYRIATLTILLLLHMCTYVCCIYSCTSH